MRTLASFCALRIFLVIPRVIELKRLTTSILRSLPNMMVTPGAARTLTLTLTLTLTPTPDPNPNPNPNPNLNPHLHQVTAGCCAIVWLIFTVLGVTFFGGRSHQCAALSHAQGWPGCGVEEGASINSVEPQP